MQIALFPAPSLCAARASAARSRFSRSSAAAECHWQQGTGCCTADEEANHITNAPDHAIIRDHNTRCTSMAFSSDVQRNTLPRTSKLLLKTVLSNSTIHGRGNWTTLAAQSHAWREQARQQSWLRGQQPGSAHSTAHQQSWLQGQQSGSAHSTAQVPPRC